MLMKAVMPKKFQLNVIPDFRTFLFPDGGEIHYIGGSDILPAPLEADDEARAIGYLGSAHDEEARKLLIEHNLRLVVYIAKKFDNTGVGVEDLISIGTIGLIKAINSYNPEKNIKLATYASRCIENEILMFLRKNNKLRQEISLDEPLNVDYDGNELLLSDIIGTDKDIVQDEIEHNDQKEKFYHALHYLNPREQQILMMRYGLIGHEELTQKDVAEILGISQSYISRLEKKIIKKLRNKLKDDE